MRKVIILPEWRRVRGAIEADASHRTERLWEKPLQHDSHQEPPLLRRENARAARRRDLIGSRTGLRATDVVPSMLSLDRSSCGAPQ